MISLFPGTTPQDTNGAFAVLALLGDDNKFKQRLEELMKHAAEAQQTLNEVHEQRKIAANDKMNASLLLEEANQMHKEATEKLQAAETQHAALNKREVELRDLKDQLQRDADNHFKNREIANQAKEGQLYIQAENLAKKEQSLLDRKSDLDELEKKNQQVHNQKLKELADQATANKHQADHLSVLKAELEAKLSKLKNVITQI